MSLYMTSEGEKINFITDLLASELMAMDTISYNFAVRYIIEQTALKEYDVRRFLNIAINRLVRCNMVKSVINNTISRV
ncbi:MAG: hypothetical protein H8D23_18770 [Candidatus Brocadiales bacterium]|nr:hypothetical protein [Candidatus Brocadiales bacterium]